MREGSRRHQRPLRVHSAAHWRPLPPAPEGPCATVPATCRHLLTRPLPSGAIEPPPGLRVARRSASCCRDLAASSAPPSARNGAARAERGRRGHDSSRTPDALARACVIKDRSHPESVNTTVSLARLRAPIPVRKDNTRQCRATGVAPQWVHHTRDYIKSAQLDETQGDTKV